MSELIDLVARQAGSIPDRVALRSESDSLTYGMLPFAIAATAARINAADPSGAPVGIDLDNGVTWVLTDLALRQLGRAAVPLPTFFLPEQRAAALADAGASSVVQACGIRRLDTMPVRLPPGTAKISYTSGSTGVPKGICLSEEQLHATAQAVVDRLGADRAGHHLPLLSLGVLLENVAGLYATLMAGAEYRALPAQAVGLANPFAPDFAAMTDAVAASEATSLILVPELLRGLVTHMERSGRFLPSLTLVAVGGARLPDGLLDRAALAGLPVVQGYGLTECGSVVALQRVGEPGVGSVGEPLDHVELALAPDGEVIIAGNTHGGIIGYEQATTPLATGDIGRLDDSGRLWIVGRKNNLIVTAFGRNISPEWIEAELLGQPEIAQAMVHGNGAAALSALIVPISVGIDPSPAVARVNVALPDYARIAAWELSRPFSPRDGTATANGRPRRDAILARQAALPFFDHLVCATAAARGRLMAVPQLQAGLRGDIGLSTYLDYLGQAYHHVRHTVPLMRAARERLLDRPDLVAALDDYIAEEQGHELWILDDIAAAGGVPAAIIEAGPSPQTRAMVDHAYRTIAEGNPAAFFGMVFVLEGTSIALAQQGADAVRRTLDLPPEAFRYLTSHGALDQDHMRFFEQLMNRLDDPRDQQAILTMANEIFELFAGIFAAIRLEPAHAPA